MEGGWEERYVERLIFFRLFPEIFPVLGYIIACRVIPSKQLTGKAKGSPFPQHTQTRTLHTWPSLLLLPCPFQSTDEEENRPSLFEAGTLGVFLPGHCGEEPQLPRSWSCRVRKFHNLWGWDILSFIAKHGANTLSQLVTWLRVVQRACVLSSPGEGWEGQGAKKGNSLLLALPRTRLIKRALVVFCARSHCSLCGLRCVN